MLTRAGRSSRSRGSLFNYKLRMPYIGIAYVSYILSYLSRLVGESLVHTNAPASQLWKINIDATARLSHVFAKLPLSWKSTMTLQSLDTLRDPICISTVTISPQHFTIRPRIAWSCEKFDLERVFSSSPCSDARIHLVSLST